MKKGRAKSLLGTRVNERVTKVGGENFSPAEEILMENYLGINFSPAEKSYLWAIIKGLGLREEVKRRKVLKRMGLPR